MAKKNNVPATAEVVAAPKKRLEVACLHGSCAGQAHGTIAVECEPWEVPVYLMCHHFNHEGHKTTVAIDGLEYHRLAVSPIAPPVASAEVKPAEQSSSTTITAPLLWRR